MIARLREQQPAIAALCQRYGVVRLEVFGSAVGDAFDSAHSDIDFLVSFLPHPTFSRFEQYFGLREDLQALLGATIDLVIAEALQNPYLIRSVNAQRQLLYAA